MTDFASPPASRRCVIGSILDVKYQAHPPGIVDWGTTPRDFLEQKVAMIWTTTGNLSNIRTSAKFPFGVAMLPEDKRRGSPTGGGNFYLFQIGERDAARGLPALPALDHQPERAAQWGIDTGYIATRADAWETTIMRKYVTDFPAAAVARDQLQYAVAGASTHDNQRVIQALNDLSAGSAHGAQAAGRSIAGSAGDRGAVLRPFQKKPDLTGGFVMLRRRRLLIDECQFACRAGDRPRADSAELTFYYPVAVRQARWQRSWTDIASGTGRKPGSRSKRYMRATTARP